jgi:Thioredoxin
MTPDGRWYHALLGLCLGLAGCMLHRQATVRVVDRGPNPSHLPQSALYETLTSPSRQGPADAPVVIVEFTSGCGVCARIDSLLTVVAASYPEGVALIRWRFLRTADSIRREILEALPCAVKAHRAAEYVRLEAGAGSVPEWSVVAHELGMPRPGRFVRCADSAQRIATSVAAETEAAERWNIARAPAVYINGALEPSPLDYDSLITAAARALGREP